MLFRGTLSNFRLKSIVCISLWFLGDLRTLYYDVYFLLFFFFFCYFCYSNWARKSIFLHFHTNLIWLASRINKKSRKSEKSGRLQIFLEIYLQRFDLLIIFHHTYLNKAHGIAMDVNDVHRESRPSSPRILRRWISCAIGLPSFLKLAH